MMQLSNKSNIVDAIDAARAAAAMVEAGIRHAGAVANELTRLRADLQSRGFWGGPDLDELARVTARGGVILFGDDGAGGELRFLGLHPDAETAKSVARWILRRPGGGRVLFDRSRHSITGVAEYAIVTASWEPATRKPKPNAWPAKRKHRRAK